MSRTHVQPERDEDPGFELSERSPIKAPARVWLSIAAVLGMGIVAWTRAESNREADSKRIDQLQSEMREFRGVVQQVRDASIKLEGNAAAMQRQLDRMDRMAR